MRVLHVIPSYPPATRAGGPPVAVATLCEALARRGVEAEVFTTDDALDDGAVEPADGAPRTVRGVPVRRFALARPRRMKVAPSLRRALLDEAPRFDLVHVHTLWNPTSALASHAARRRGVPCVVTPRGMLDPVIVGRRAWLRAPLARLVTAPQLGAAAVVHFTADDERTRAVLYGARPSTCVVPNTVDPAEAPASPAEGERFLERFPAARGRRLVLFLGRLSWKKGLDLLVEAFGGIARRHPDVTLVIAGPDDEGLAAGLRRALDAEGALDRAIFTGALRGAEKRAALAAASIFALPSLQENFAVAAVEAMLAGLPVILSERVALHGVAALAGAGISTRLDAAEVERALDALVSDPERARSMGARGRRLALERFAPDAVAARMHRIYEDVLSGGRTTDDWR